MNEEQQAIESIRGTKRTKCACGCNEFITQLNQYDVYASDEDEERLVFWRSESTEEPLRFYCRDCGQEYDNELNLISNPE
jgi:hypothetical protein